MQGCSLDTAYSISEGPMSIGSLGEEIDIFWYMICDWPKVCFADQGQIIEPTSEAFREGAWSVAMSLLMY